MSGDIQIGVLRMKQKKIRLKTVAEAKEFVNIASKCDFDIDICYNHIVIDAKSILGVLSMDLTRELTVKWYGDDEVFEHFLEVKAADSNTAA